MNKIKTKRKSNVKIKKLEKAKIYSQRLKNNMVQIKEKTNDTTQEDTPTEYGTNEIIYTANTIVNNSIDKFNKYGRKSVKQTKTNIEQTTKRIKNKIQNRNIKKNAKNIKSKTIKTASNKIKGTNLKNTKRVIKNAPKTAQKTIKTTKKITKETAKGVKRAYKGTKVAVKSIAKGIKVSVKATVLAVKAIIAGAKALISAIIAGGWVAIVIIVVICVIAMICNSIFGIFFSNEKDIGDKTMSSVIREINVDFTNKITDIQKNNQHDDYEINSNRAEWKDVLSVYAVITSNGDEATNVVTLDEQKINELKKIFWEMNIISSRVDEQEKEIEITDENGTTKKEIVKRKILHINIDSKSIEEMIQLYNFNAKQLEQLVELRKDKYNSMWSYVLYGSSTGSNQIVTVALSQVGNVGGQPYWSWYGFENRVEWCACFVSWCANECNYIEAGALPKFASCESEGVVWFRTCGLWQEKGYTAQPGDIIFFDWDNDKKADHTGIVEKCENGKVYTIEGNTSGDVCKQKDYDINSSVILGYGTPMY